jgi:hypothetical protein
VLPKPQVSLAGLRDSAKNVFDLELVERVITIGFKREPMPRTCTRSPTKASCAPRSSTSSSA